MNMEVEGEGWFDTWRLRAIAASVGAELRSRFGVNAFYSPQQVLLACDARRVFEHSRGCALAMFAEPGALHDILLDYGISDPADEMRRIMARKILSDDAANAACSAFDFHAVALISSDLTSGDSGADGSGPGAD